MARKATKRAAKGGASAASDRKARTLAPAARGKAGIEGSFSIRFKAAIQRPVISEASQKLEPEEWAFLALPKKASDQLPSRGMVSVEGTLNGSPLIATLQPDGEGGHWLRLTRAMLNEAGAKVGDTVIIEVAPAKNEPEPEVPSDWRDALALAPAKVRGVWSAITPMARRDWIQWITSGKRAATRAIRIEKACSMLAAGKRRPCCFDRSGMYSKSLRGPVSDASDCS